LLGRHFLAESNMDQITGRFNAQMADKLLVLAEEAVWGGERSRVGDLKSFITQEQITIEKKGVDSFVVPHVARLIVASNEPWAVHADPDDRRFVFLDVANTYAQDIDYFGALYRQMEGGGYAALIQFLMNRDLTNWVPQHRPDTGFGQDVREASMSSEERFWFQVLTEGEVPVWRSDCLSHMDHTTRDWEAIPKEFAYEAYIRQCRDRGKYRTASQSEFWNTFYRMIGAESKSDKDVFKGPRIHYDGKRARTVLLPPLASLRRMYDEANKTVTDWSEGVDAVDVTMDANKPYVS